MKKLLFTWMLCACAIGAAASSFSGNYTVVGTSTVSGTTTLAIEQSGDTYTLTIDSWALDGAIQEALTIEGLNAATSGNYTVYTAANATATIGSTATTATVTARVLGDYAVADIALIGENATIAFNNVGDHFQLPNADMEAWTASSGEPDRWHGFKSATGTYKSTSSSNIKLEKSTDVHSGSTGEYSAVMTAAKILFVIANGTMTNGQLVANSMTAASTDNHAEMSKTSTNTDNNGDPFYMDLYAKPDTFSVWLKYTQGTTNSSYKASVSAVAFDGSYYQEPYDSDYDCVAGRAKNAAIAACDWSRFAIPFDYDSYADNNAEAAAIFVTFATNATPGTGSKGDQLYVDDIELIYNASLTDLKYQGTTLTGFDAAVTEYAIDLSENVAPSLDDVTATIEGASAVLTKSLESFDGGWRVYVTVVSGDLLKATTYVITFNAPTDEGDINMDGLVNSDDVTTLIDYLLGNNPMPCNLAACDVDGNGTINSDDVTALINILLNEK